jgi:hypothetical protein
MNKEQVMKAAECDFNRIWICQHSTKKGSKCQGPCNVMEIHESLQMCPVCSNPLELGHCTNVICVNHE